MGTDPALLVRVAETLERGRVPFALIGAAALAVHGVSRSTLDVDLLVSDRRVLAPPFWALLSGDADVDIRTGDDADPLAGVVRATAAGERDVDVVVGRGAWIAEVVARAEPVPHGGRAIPVVRASDLILLKLYAGGSQDRWDIEQLLADDGRAALIDEVERALPRLPPRAGRLWRTLRDPP